MIRPCPRCVELSLVLWHGLHSWSFFWFPGVLFLVNIALWVMCLKWVYPSLSVRNLVAYLSATVAQSGEVCLISSIFLSHSLGAVGGFRLFLENSSVSCLTVVLSSGAPISPNEYSLRRGNCICVC
jgi:hypothetical protein